MPAAENDLIIELYAKLGGHYADPEKAYDGPDDTEGHFVKRAVVHCTDGETSGRWVLDCTRVDGTTFSVTGPTHAAALVAAIAEA